MNNFQYDMMIDAMTDEVFEHCVDLLWPVLAYRYMKREEVRRVDLKEQVTGIAERYALSSTLSLPMDKTAQGTIEKYVDALRFYFDKGFLPVETGSRAEAYALRARTIMENKGQSEDIMADMEDLFAIYLCLSRAAWAGIKGGKPAPIRDISFHIGEEDAAFLNELRLHRFEKPVSPILRAVAGGGQLSEKQKDYTYLNHILLFCRLMQAQGGFGKGEIA